MPIVTADQTRSKVFTDACERIINHRGYPAKRIFRIVKWHKAVTKVCDDINDSWLTLLKGYAELDDRGEFVPQDGRPGTWKLSEEVLKDPAKMQKHWEDVKEFNTLEVEAKVMPLDYSEVAKADLTPAEVAALGELLATATAES